MRRGVGKLAASVALTVLVIAGSAVPAEAAGYSLTLTTLGRDGSSVATTGSAVDVSSGVSYDLTSSKATSLPKATYAVLVDVWNANDDTDTLGAKIVSVTGATKVTIDARQGKETDGVTRHLAGRWLFATFGRPPLRGRQRLGQS
jgi:hypothetical protein